MGIRRRRKTLPRRTYPRAVPWDSSGRRIPCITGSYREVPAFRPTAARRKCRHGADGIIRHASRRECEWLILCPPCREVFRRRQNRARPATRLCCSKGPGCASRGKVAFAEFGLLTSRRVSTSIGTGGLGTRAPPPRWQTIGLPRGFVDLRFSGKSLPSLQDRIAPKRRRHSTRRRHERCYVYYGFYSPACPSFIGSSLLPRPFFS